MNSMQVNSAVHLSKDLKVKMGSYYTPPMDFNLGSLTEDGMLIYEAACDKLLSEVAQ